MLTQDIKDRLIKWNNTPSHERDYDEGRRLLYAASRNSILNRQLSMATERNKERIDAMLSKYIRFVLDEVTREQVAEMDRQVKRILDDNLSLAVEKDKAEPRGRREDHDSLPDEIKAKYVENLDILRKMRELHMTLRRLSVYIRMNTVPCPDSERYPFLKEMIRLDKLYHENWKVYDRYVPVAEKSSEVAADEDADGSDGSDEKCESEDSEE